MIPRIPRRNSSAAGLFVFPCVHLTLFARASEKIKSC